MKTFLTIAIIFFVCNLYGQKEEWHPNLDMWDSISLEEYNHYFTISMMDSNYNYTFNYSVNETDTSLLVTDSLAAIKFLIDIIVQQTETIKEEDKAYDILKYVNTDGEIIDKNKFIKAVKKFNEQ